MMPRYRLALTLSLLIFLATGASIIHAHGIGLPQVINVDNGPYLVSVWSDPNPLRVDQTHIVIAVMDPATRAPLVQDVTVAVQMQIPGEPNSAIIETAKSDNSVNQLLYVVQFNDLPTAGQWQATVMIDGSRGSAAEVTFPLEITPALRYNWVRIGLAGLAAVTVAWLLIASLQALMHAFPPPSAARRKVMSNR